jgi:N-acetyl-1-D-myo-inositol-2-amino-2-deoxy-alpha-D-glucopyranoside deacetylase
MNDRLNAVGGAILALVIGVVIGVVTTFAHRAYPIDIGIRVPLGLVAGLAIVAALLVGFRLVSPKRTLAVAAAVGVVGAIAVLAFPGTGGSLLVIDDPIGYIWAVGPVAIAVVAVGWPRRRR